MHNLKRPIHIVKNRNCYFSCRELNSNDSPFCKKNVILKCNIFTDVMIGPYNSNDHFYEHLLNYGVVHLFLIASSIKRYIL